MSTFRPSALANDPNHSSIIYIRMPAADIDQLRAYVRLLINSMLYDLLPPAITLDGREARGNLREFGLWLEESAALNRMEQIQRAASYMRGLGGKLITVWQNRNQIITTYGKEETISGNQGLHLHYTPETDDEAERLSKALGETSFVVQARDVSGDRMSLGPRNHLSEANRIETRRNYTTYEVKALPSDELFFFAYGLQGRIHQYHYDKNPMMLQRSQIAPVTQSSITAERPLCLEHLESVIGFQKMRQLLTPALDRDEKNREAAEVQMNGCRVYRWERMRDDTGAKTFFTQVWLPDAKKPVLDDKKGYASAMERDAKIAATLSIFDARDNVTIAVVMDTDDPLAAAATLF
jgi:type IV secretory pathway TraG/TraD family ATPase VirD4